MKTRTGGTAMYCPGCKKITSCGKFGTDKQRLRFEGHPDFHFFQRRRKCRSCGHKFVTGEVDMKLLYELTRSRDLLDEMTKHAEEADERVRESRKVSELLRKLSESWSSLQVHRERRL
jgi:hypothetical protein